MNLTSKLHLTYPEVQCRRLMEIKKRQCTLQVHVCWGNTHFVKNHFLKTIKDYQEISEDYFVIFTHNLLPTVWYLKPQGS
jgi:hypothetical protein